MKKRSTGGSFLLKQVLIEDRTRNPTNEAVISSLAQVENQIKQAIEHRTEQTIFRSKVRWIEGGETNSKMFFSLEK